MKIIAELQQGSEAWLAHRRTTRNASEAPAVMGASPYTTRAQLLRQRATGIEPEIDAATQARFNRGHAVEPALRALAEAHIGEDLYPVIGVSDDGYLGASFDGVNLDETVIFEAKQSNATKAAHIARAEIPPVDYWQIVHQFAVCESAERCHYYVGDGTEDGTVDLCITRESIVADIPKLRAAWEQFDKDVAAYQPEPAAAPATAGRAPETLPALRVEVTGMVTASNLAEFKASAMQVLGSINRDLQTDEDFANAEQTVKWCKEVEDRLGATKDAVLAQTADIEAVFRTMDEVSAETRRIRLELDRLVKAEKENRKAEIVQKARAAYGEHEAGLRAETKEVWIAQPPPDFAGAIKGKRTLSSMKDAVDTVLANAKIAANESAKHIRAALACLSEETEGHKHLFPDYRDFIAKPIEDIRALVRGRIAEHQQREAERLEAERERIRQEEVARLEREQHAEADRAAREQAAAPAPDTQPANAAPAETDPRMASAIEHGMSGVNFSPSAPAPSAAAVVPAPAAQINLGDINEWIAPLSINAAGLASLGFKPAATKGAAKLYAGADFPRICDALGRLIAEAPARAAQKKAA